MKSISIKLALAGMACAAATVALAAAPMQEGAAHAAPMHPPMMGGNMMGSDKKDGGMMGMMRNCQSMMGASGEGAGPMHGMRMPPGNEKLELQMHAEMMQKIGEIAARYADRIKETR